MNYVETFQIENCNRIVLESYKKLSHARDGKVFATSNIRDQTLINRVLVLLRHLPDSGDMMIKMGNVPLLRVTVYTDGEHHYFEFYSNRIKAPDTSFYSDPPPQVQQLYDLLTHQVRPFGG